MQDKEKKHPLEGEEPISGKPDIKEDVSDADVTDAEVSDTDTADTDGIYDDDDGAYLLETLTFDGDSEEKKKPKSKKKSRFGMIKRQKIMLMAFAFLTVTFALLYFLVFKPDYEEAVTPAPEEKMELIEGEVYDSSGVSVLMFPQVPRTNVKNINVVNQYGTFDVTRVYDDKGKITSDFAVAQYPAAPFDQQMAAKIAVDAGYAKIMTRVVEACDDYSVYGLTEANKNRACVTITDLDGNKYVFYIGNEVPGGGFYCRMQDRAAVYTVPSTVSETLLTSAEALLTPQLGPTSVGTSQTFEIDELLISKNGEPFVAIQSRNYVRSVLLASIKALKEDENCGISDELRSLINTYLNKEDDTSLKKMLEQMENEKEIEEVKTILDSKDFLYTMRDTFLVSAYRMIYPSEYVVDDDNVGNQLLAYLNGLQGSYVFAAGDGKTPLWADDELMQLCGFYDLENPMFELYYKYGDEEGIIIFADSGSDVYYFAYSYVYDIVVMIEKSVVDFVTWDLLDYCSVYPFQDYIGDVSKVSVSASKLYYKGKSYSVSEAFRYMYVTENDADGKEKNVLNCYAESTGLAVKGNNVTKNPIQAFYNTAIKLKMVGYTAEESFDLANKEEYARMTVTYASGTVKEYVFYRFGGYCYMEIDGEPGIFYTSLTTVNKMLIDAVRAANGLTVSPNDEYADLPDFYLSNNGANGNG